MQHQSQEAIPRSSLFPFLLPHWLHRLKRQPKTPKSCCRDSCSFNDHKETIIRNVQFPNPPPLERLMRPKNPQLCLRNSCSGSKENSVKEQDALPKLRRSIQDGKELSRGSRYFPIVISAVGLMGRNQASDTASSRPGMMGRGDAWHWLTPHRRACSADPSRDHRAPAAAVR